MKDFQFQFLQAPNFIKYGTRGEIMEMRCKMCGTVIAHRGKTLVSRQPDARGVWVEEYDVSLRFHADFFEALIEFQEPGVWHVVNGCRSCLTSTLKPNRLKELFIADMIDQRGIGFLEGSENFTPIRIGPTNGLSALDKASVE